MGLNAEYDTNIVTTITEKFRKNIKKCFPVCKLYVLDEYLLIRHPKKFQKSKSDRNATARLYFEKIIKKSEYVTKEEIVVENDYYYVPSENDKQLMYCVDQILEFVVSKMEERTEDFVSIKEIFFSFYKTVGVNFPPVTIEDRFATSKLALGD